ncbi:MAG TPA: PfkB family carbohydrate kinase [bacterium]|nr:PfkB family carbohydrate kinase [bacterium]
MSRAQVVVIGGVNVDVIATAAGPLMPRASNPGRIRISPGGAGRNIAENLAHLGVATRLLAAVDAHPLAEIAVRQAADAGVDVSGIVRLPGHGSYYAALVADGVVEWAVSDMGACEALSAGHLDAESASLQGAEMVVVDANLSPAVIERAAAFTGAGLCVVPVSAAKAARIRRVLRRASLIVLSADEAAALSEMRVASPEDALRAAAALRPGPGSTVVVTMSGRGLGWITEGRFWVEALHGRIVDPSGAGDAVAAVAIYAQLTGLEPHRAAELAAAAGAMTISVEGATHPGLSLDALHTLVHASA